MAKPKTLTIAPADEAKLLDLLAEQYDRVRDRLTTEAGWERLQQFFYDHLVRQSALTPLICEWGRAGHPAAHRALMAYIGEMTDVGRLNEMRTSVQDYLGWHARQESRFVPFPRGRHVVQHLMRDIWLPMMIDNAAAGTGLEPTRGPATTTPSVAYFCSKALKQKGIRLTEREVNKIYWRRHRVAGLLEASMPA
jgi:hypothetical protein